jgi:hypothetical protein
VLQRPEYLAALGADQYVGNIARSGLDRKRSI